jgi:hypothetical protein
MRGLSIRVVLPFKAPVTAAPIVWRIPLKLGGTIEPHLTRWPNALNPRKVAESKLNHRSHTWVSQVADDDGRLKRVSDLAPHVHMGADRGQLRFGKSLPQ